MNIVRMNKVIFAVLFILSLVSCRECLNLGTCKHKTGRRSIGRDSLTRHSQFHLSASTTSNLSINANKNNNDPSNTPPYTLSKPQSVYVALTTLFVTCLIVADVIGMKIFEVKLPFSILGFNRIEHTCGMLTFPVTFLIGDIVNEYFGPKATKATVYLGLTMSLFVFIVINIATALPFLDKPFNIPMAAFNTVFGNTKILYVASLFAYLVGQLLDIWIFGALKKLTRGKHLWFRAAGSTVLSQLIDSFLVTYVALNLGKRLTNQIPASIADVVGIAMTGYSLKFFLAMLITPLLYATRSFLQKNFNLVPVPVDYDESKI